MWVGVCIGLAGMLLIGSMNIIGKMDPINSIIKKKNKINKISFDTKNGLKGTLSIFLSKPKGFLEPFSCKRIKWKVTITTNNIGNKKWKE